MVSTTSTYNLQIPTVGSDEDVWGGYINATITAVGNLLDGTTPVTGIDINSGAIDGTPVGANSASTGAFTTLNVSTGLSANLSTNGYDIVTTSNADLDLAPDGTGKVVVKGNTNSGKIVLNCENNSHGVTLASPPHSASATYEVALPNALGTSNASSVITSDANGNIKLSEEVQATCFLETVISLSGTSPTVDCDEGNFFYISTSGNTTFTFDYSGVNLTTNDAYGFILKITAGGTHTLTWPGTVDWAGGSAPDAPASGETDMYGFITHDGGSTWYGFLAGDAMS
jgi:hypothetical protein|tara:strand:+ start:342 stop:1196 length:855 start_codon:yes stop_codon:yes gene_type:complete